MSYINAITLHKITNNSTKAWEDVNMDYFKVLLDSVQGNGKFPPTSIVDWCKTGVGNIALTFDDGHLSDYELVFPLLQQYDAKATFFIVSDFVGKKGYVSWSQLREMSDANMEIASHSKTHPYLTTLSKKNLTIELYESKQKIEQNIGIQVNSFAYPYGDCSQKTHNIAFDLGYNHICNSKPGLTKERHRIIARNSITSIDKIIDIDLVLQPSFNDLLVKRANYMIRSSLKKMLGIEGYIRLRNSILKA